MMKIAVLGATGPTGLQVLTQGLERGFEIIALVRNPTKIETVHEKLKVVKADVFSSKSLEEHLVGCDAVMYCIGGGLGFSTVTLYSDSTKAVVEAMKASSVRRFFCVSSWYTKKTNEEPFWWSWFVKPVMLGRLTDDMYRMEMHLEENAADIDYTSVRCSGLTNGDKSDKEMLVHEGIYCPNGSYSIPRANVASFMLDSLENGTYKKQLISIGLTK